MQTAIPSSRPKSRSERADQFKLGQFWWSRDGTTLSRIVVIADDRSIMAVEVGHTHRHSYYMDGAKHYMNDKDGDLVWLETDSKVILKYNLDPEGTQRKEK